MPDGERRRSDGYVTRAELRAVEGRWRDRFARLDAGLKFFDQMTELGLRELLPVMLRNEKIRQTTRAIAEGRYKWLVRFTAYMLPFSLAVGAVGGSIAILRTLGIMR